MYYYPQDNRGYQQNYQQGYPQQQVNQYQQGDRKSVV